MVRMVVGLLLALLIPALTRAQGRTKLYYFESKDHRGGVRDGAGKIIVPAEYLAIGAGDTVRGELIFLYSDRADSSGPGYASPMMAFNRQGQFLFKPFFFDNGADYLSEGLFRIVRNRKIGFADREGNIVIQPQFGFALPFQHGLSFFCNDCTFYRDSLHPDDEHNLRLTSGNWGVMDQSGRILSAKSAAHRERIEDGELADFVPLGITEDRLDITDSLLASLPPQFVYTPEETALLKKVTSSGYLGSMMSANVLTDSGTRVTYEIVERPKASFPFYWIKGFHIINGVYTDAEENFLISSSGADLYRYEPTGDTRELLLPWKTRLRRK